MHPKDVAARAIEPGEDEDLVALAQPIQGLEHAGLEDEPCVRRPLVALLRGRRKVGQGRFDPADRREFETWLAHVEELISATCLRRTRSRAPLPPERSGEERPWRDSGRCTRPAERRLERG